MMKTNFEYDLVVAKDLSVWTAIMLAALQQASLVKSKFLYDSLEWFSYTVQECYDETGLRRKSQHSSIRELINEGYIIEPPIRLFSKRHFCLLERENEKQTIQREISRSA